MIAIVGGGWFGCHLARAMKLRSIPFELFEARDRLFDGASGYNQNRLHLGFHYPRSAVTRRETFEFAQTFIREYPTLSQEIEENIYAVVKDESLIDWETYRAVVSGPWWQERNPDEYGLVGVSGCLQCNERLILTNKAREFFTERLAGHLRLGERYIDQPGYDMVINCTYQTWRPAGADLVYEPCATLLYETKNSRAITLMDGPFYSVYPFESGMATLYSPNYSRLARCGTADEALALLGSRDAVNEDWRRRRMEHGVSRWLPSFRDEYQYVGWHGAVRAILTDASDARTCRVVQHGNMIHVISGKIDSIFEAERQVLRCLDCS